MTCLTNDGIFLGKSDDGTGDNQYLPLKWGNRHGLIAGATGTGKTVTLQVLTEGFSAAGVPVFLADAKGDLSGLARNSDMQDFLTKRASAIGFADEYESAAFPAVFWDLFGEQGHPVRTTISEIGPLLLSRMLELNDTQEGVMNIAFRVADEQGLLLLDLKDLRSLLGVVNDQRAEISSIYGNVSPQSVGAIQRALLRLEDQGADKFFGEPALDLRDFMRTDKNGRGMMSILAADKLMNSPRLYGTFLLWMLSELFEELPEAGDPDRPKLVFFFDEAHLLFDDAPKALLEKVEQVVRLIRSKGVGIFFVTQSPDDIPESVLGQLGNRIQHALRAFTPKQQKAIRLAAQTYRPNPKFDVEDVITTLGVGEALVSTLENKGEPSIVERTLIRPPSSKLGPISNAVRKSILTESDLADKYDEAIDNQSAYEILQERAEKAAKAAAKEQENTPEPKRKASNRQSVGEAAIKSLTRAVSSSIGRTIAKALLRGILGALKR
ncbi:helicase HerA-like domain-containing protein [uncultured Sneathiella sp.]|uniref:helicase HerA-like domain-containing protein n=1 Tax=uncultured Sneathiella sp. TaxID=879315 RepID=UPI0030ED1E95|tara:strand:- start:8994 stop:10478 length:1485 start_codon:yes stop_codon:yes gene_type:complete